MIAIQVLTDVIITHPSLLASVPADPETATSSDASPTPSPFLKPVTKTFLKAFNSSAAELSQTACTAASKLLLLNILPQNSAADILKTFTLAYFNPETAANPALRQALSYFLPVFCHSRQKNAALMGQIVVSILQKLMLMRDDLDEEAEDMVSWAVVAGHLSEWTDGRRVVGATELGLDGKTNTLEGAEEPHILLAIELLERALKDNCTKEEKKPLLTLLSKLHIASSPISKNESVDEETLRTVHALASEAVEAKLGPDATTRNYISKLEIALTKRLGDVEHITQLPADDETITPDATELPTAVAPAEGEEDTMMADPQAEGTRMPLEDEDEEEGDTTTVAIGRDEALRAITESDIVDSLLDSEM
jgi:condensin complex subunit 3